MLDEWLRTAELDEGTRDMYCGYVDRNIRPALGEEPVRKVSTRMLEPLYAELRRCRVRCDGKPFVEHRPEGEHDCTKKNASRMRASRWLRRPFGSSTQS